MKKKHVSKEISSLPIRSVLPTQDANIYNPNVNAGQAPIMLDPNIYNPNKKAQATPYFQSYMYAYGQRPAYVEPVEEIPVAPVAVKPFKSKRTFFVVIIALMSILILATAVMSGLGMVPLLSKFNGDEAAVAIGLDDLIMSSLKKFLSLEIDTEQSIYYYESILINIEELEPIAMIASYMIIITILLTVLLAFYSLLKSFGALKSKKRKKFFFITTLILAFAVGFLLMGSVWSGGGLAEIFNYIKGTSDSLNVGLGTLLILGGAFVMWVASWFAYRKNKAEKKAKKLNKKNAKNEAKLANQQKKAIVA